MGGKSPTAAGTAGDAALALLLIPTQTTQAGPWKEREGLPGNSQGCASSREDPGPAPAPWLLVAIMLLLVLLFFVQKRPLPKIP